MTKTNVRKYTIRDNIKLYAGLAGDLIKDLMPRKPSLATLAATSGILIGSAAPVLANNVILETTTQNDCNNSNQMQRTRIKTNLGSTTVTYDMNNYGKPDEMKFWVDAFSQNNLTIGFLAEGQTDNGHKSYADIGACVGERINNTDYSLFVGPTVQPGVKPVMFYQFSAKDTSKTKNLVMALVDDRTIFLSENNIDFRAYASGQQGDFFGGLGHRQKGENLTRLYGGLGFNNGSVGSFGVFRYYPKKADRKGKFKIQSAFQEPQGSIGLSSVNIWNDMEGPGIRDVSTPYFTSFLAKGNLTSLIEGNFSPQIQDYQVMLGKDLGVTKLGLGTNYHDEGGKSRWSGLIHVAKDVNLGKAGKAYLEAKYNTRNRDIGFFGNYNRNF